VPDIINSWEIKEGLGTRIIGQNIHCFSEIDSTNNYAKYLLKRVAMTVRLFWPNTRPRDGKAWQKLGFHGRKGIWMSIVLRPAVGLEDVQIITLAAAVAVVLAFKKVMA